SVRNEMRGSGVDFTYVMPYLVNTELASGTRGLRWPPIVEPEDVARAIVSAVKKRRLEVYVPKIGRLTAMLPIILPRPIVDWIGQQMGLNKLFKKVDTTERAPYIERTTGTDPSDSTETKDKPKVRRPRPRAGPARRATP